MDNQYFQHFQPMAMACRQPACMVVYLFSENGMVLGNCRKHRRCRHDGGKSPLPCIDKTLSEKRYSYFIQSINAFNGFGNRSCG